jgi:hypothetical protein
MSTIHAPSKPEHTHQPTEKVGLSQPVPVAGGATLSASTSASAVVLTVATPSIWHQQR